MAKEYKLNYTLSYKTGLSHETTDVEIYKLVESDESVIVVDLSGQNNGITFTLDTNDDQLFGPIKSTVAELTLVNRTNFEFMHFVLAELFIYKIKVYKTPENGSKELYFQGYNIIPDYKENYTQPPYYTLLTFTDGIAYLKQFRFSTLQQGTIFDINLNDTIYDGYVNKYQYMTVKDILTEIFNVIDLDNEFKYHTMVYVSPYDTSTPSDYNWMEFLNLKINVFPYREKSFYDVLADVLKGLGVIIKYDSGLNWWIYNPLFTKEANMTDYGIHVLGSTFGFIEKRVEPFKLKQITDANGEFFFANKSRSLTIKPKYDKVNFTVDLLPVELCEKGKIEDYTLELLGLSGDYWIRYNDIKTVPREGDVDEYPYLRLMACEYTPTFTENIWLEVLPEKYQTDNLRFGAVKGKLFTIPNDVLNSREYKYQIILDMEFVDTPNYPFDPDDIENDMRRMLPFMVYGRDHAGHEYTLIKLGSDGNRYKFEQKSPDYGYRVVKCYNYYGIKDYDWFMKMNNRKKYIIEFESDAFYGSPPFEGNLDISIYFLNSYKVETHIYNIEIKTVTKEDKYKKQSLLNPKKLDKFNFKEYKTTFHISEFFLSDEYSDRQKDRLKPLAITTTCFMDYDLHIVNKWTVFGIYNTSLIKGLSEIYGGHYLKYISTITSDMVGPITPVLELQETKSNNLKYFINRYTKNDKTGLTNVELVSLESAVPDYSFNVIDEYNFGKTSTDGEDHTISFNAHPNAKYTTLTYYYGITGDPEFTIESVTQQTLGQNDIGSVIIRYKPTEANVTNSATLTIYNQYYTERVNLLGNTNFGTITIVDNSPVNISFYYGRDYYSNELNWIAYTDKSYGSMYIFKNGSSMTDIVSSDHIDIEKYTKHLNSSEYTYDTTYTDYESQYGLITLTTDTYSYKFRIKQDSPNGSVYALNQNSSDIGDVWFKDTSNNYVLLPTDNAGVVEAENTVSTVHIYKTNSGGAFLSDDNVKVSLYHRAKASSDNWVHLSDIEYYTNEDISTPNYDTEDYYILVRYIPPTTYKTIYGNNTATSTYGDTYLYDDSYHLIPSSEQQMFDPLYTSKTIYVYKDDTGSSIIPDDYIYVTYLRRLSGASSWSLVTEYDQYSSSTGINLTDLDTYETLIKVEYFPPADENGDLYGYNTDENNTGVIYVKKDDDSYAAIDSSGVTKIEDNKQNTTVNLYKSTSGTAITRADCIDLKLYYRDKNTTDSWTFGFDIKRYTSQSISLQNIENKDNYISVLFTDYDGDVYGQNMDVDDLPDIYLKRDNNSYIKFTTSETMLEEDRTNTDLYLYKSSSGDAIVYDDGLTVKVYTRDKFTTNSWTLSATYDDYQSSAIDVTDNWQYDYKLELYYEAPVYKGIFGDNEAAGSYGNTYLYDGSYHDIPSSESLMFNAPYKSKIINVYNSNTGGSIIPDDYITVSHMKRLSGASSWTLVNEYNQYSSSTDISMTSIDTYEQLIKVEYLPPPPENGDLYGYNSGASNTGTIYIKDDDDNYLAIDETEITKLEDNKQKTSVYLYKSTSGTNITRADCIDLKLYYRDANTSDSWSLVRTEYRYETSEFDLQDIENKDNYISVLFTDYDGDIYGINNDTSNIANAYLKTDNGTYVPFDSTLKMLEEDRTNTSLYVYKTNTGGAFSSSDHVKLSLYHRDKFTTNSWVLDTTITDYTSTSLDVTDNWQYDYKIELDYEAPATTYKDIYGQNDVTAALVMIPETEGGSYDIPDNGDEDNPIQFYTPTVETQDVYFKYASGTSIIPDDQICLKLYRRTSSTYSWSLYHEYDNIQTSDSFSIDSGTYEYEFYLWQEGGPE